MLTDSSVCPSSPLRAARTGIPILAIVLGLVGCARAGVTGEPAGPGRGDAGAGAVDAGPRLPAVAEVRGELRIDVVYPAAGATIAPVDSTFLFGSVGRGDASLEINGDDVRVAPNGAWLAYLPVPANGEYRISAVAPGQSVTGTHTVRVATPPLDMGDVRISQGSVTPSGALTFVRGEPVEVGVRGTSGALARLLLPDGTAVPLTERRAIDSTTGFMLEATREQSAISEYVGTLVVAGTIPSPDTAASGPTLVDPAEYERARSEAGGGGAVIELVRDDQVALEDWNAAIGVLEAHQPRVAVGATARADGTVIGRRQLGADQAWDFFWPNGTRFAIDGEADGFYRVRLARDLSAWVAQGDVQLLPAGEPPPRSFVGPSIQVTPTVEGADIRFALATPIPFRVIPVERGIGVEFYGGTGQPAYVGYGPGEDFVHRFEWNQPTDEIFRFDVSLNEPLWGFRSRWDGRSLVVSVRRPPRIDRLAPLRGLRIGVDAGHFAAATDIGAIGPTRVTEAEVTAAVAARLAAMIESAGAEAVQLRPADEFVPLADRPVRADREDLDLLVSIHFNAFPDGVNPFTSHGTTMFYYWPQSLMLARSLQAEVLGEFGMPDRGVRFQNLAMTRTSWMPSVLTESLYMMFPEQEAALRDSEVVDRLAAAHLRGIEDFLRGVAAERENLVR